MYLKVHGGTVEHSDPSLCITCRHSSIIRGRTLDEEVVQCSASVMRSFVVPFKVTSCSSYSDARLPSYADLVRQAWILEPHSRRRPAGFIHARELKADELSAVVAECYGEDDDGCG